MKRVVAVPGDVVQIIDGKLYVNQEQVSLPGDRKISLSGLAENPVQLEDKEYFLLGDNPDSSEDSRFALAMSGKTRSLEKCGCACFR